MNYKSFVIVASSIASRRATGLRLIVQMTNKDKRSQSRMQKVDESNVDPPDDQERVSHESNTNSKMPLATANC